MKRGKIARAILSATNAYVHLAKSSNLTCKSGWQCFIHLYSVLRNCVLYKLQYHCYYSYNYCSLYLYFFILFL